jgi:hypothetical protein
MRIKRQLASGSSPVAGRTIALMSNSERNASMRRPVLDASCWNRALGVSIRTPVSAPARLLRQRAPTARSERCLRCATSRGVVSRETTSTTKPTVSAVRDQAGFCGGGVLRVCAMLRGDVEIGSARDQQDERPSFGAPPLRSASGYRACLAHSRPVRERRAIGACTNATAYRWLVGERGPGEQRKSLGSPERRCTKNASVSHAVLLFHVKRDHPRRTPSLRSAVLHSGERRSRTSVSRETALGRSDEELRCPAAAGNEHDESDAAAAR